MAESPHTEPLDMEEALAFARDIIDRDKYGPRPQAVAKALIAAYEEIEVQSTLALTRDISRRYAFRRVSELEEQYETTRKALNDACDVAIWLSGLPCLRNSDAWTYWESGARPKLYKAMALLDSNPAISPDVSERGGEQSSQRTELAVDVDRSGMAATPERASRSETSDSAPASRSGDA